MKNNGKTIQIFLPTGNPKGIKKSEIKTDKIEIILSSKKDFLENKSIFDFMGVYILLNSLQVDMPEIYIGKGKVCTRLTSHEAKKEFWNFVFAVRLKTEEGFNESHISYLEHYFIKNAKKNERCKIEENKQIPIEPKLEESNLCELKDYIETIEILLSTLGLKIFEQIIEKAKSDKEIFICKNGLGAYAEGQYTEDGFVVFKGAKLRKEFTEFTKKTSIAKYRENLIEKGIIKEFDNNFLIFEKNYTISSPSYASSIALSRHSNGWTEWKNKKGQTLDDVYRKDKNI